MILSLDTNHLILVKDLIKKKSREPIFEQSCFTIKFENLLVIPNNIQFNYFIMIITFDFSKFWDLSNPN